MTALNYENDRMKRKPLECSYDDLPATGSWADQARYFEGRRDFRGSISRAPKYPVTPKPLPTRAAEFAQLTAYVAHASHNDFWRKPAVQRTDLLKAISRLHYKCLQNGPATTSEDEALRISAYTVDFITFFRRAKSFYVATLWSIMPRLYGPFTAGRKKLARWASTLRYARMGVQGRQEDRGNNVARSTTVGQS